MSKLLNLLVANVLATMCAQSVLCPIAAAYQCGHQISSSDLATWYPANSLFFFAHGKTRSSLEYLQDLENDVQLSDTT